MEINMRLGLLVSGVAILVVKDAQATSLHMSSPATACMASPNLSIYAGKLLNNSANLGSLSCPLLVNGDAGHKYVNYVSAYVRLGMPAGNCWVVDLQRDRSYSQYYPTDTLHPGSYDQHEWFMPRISQGNGALVLECFMGTGDWVGAYYEDVSIVNWYYVD